MSSLADQFSFVESFCKRHGLDPGQVRAEIEQRQREDQRAARFALERRVRPDPAQELLCEFRSFRSELPALLAALKEEKR
jgi:hypothetical protein